MGGFAARFITPYLGWIALGATLALIAAGIFIYHKGYDTGYDKKEAEYEAAEQEAKNKARDKLVKMEKGYDTASKKISEIPAGGCVGPASGNASDWLRQNYRGQR